MDIALTLDNAHTLNDNGKIIKLVTRISDHIEHTSPRILRGDGSNLQAFARIYFWFSMQKEFTKESLMRKIEGFLEEDLKTKGYRLEHHQVMSLIDILGRQKNANPEIWKPLMLDFDYSIKFGSANLEDCFVLFRSLHFAGFMDADVVNPLIEYLVKRGYDSNDLQKMNPEPLSPGQPNYKRAVNFICLVAEGNPKLKNKHFLTHIKVFTQ